MENWKVTALILCGFGLFKEFRPSENYLTDYLVDYKKIPLDSLVHVAYPVFTYSYLATLFLVFLLTDFVRYRAVIIVEAIAFVSTYIILIWGKTLASFVVVEVIFGVTQSTEVAYFTYIYAKVDKEHYKKVTSYTYTAVLTGRFFAAIIGQMLVSFDLMNYHELNYLTLGSMTIGLLIVLFLPQVQDSVYFNRVPRGNYLGTLPAISQTGEPILRNVEPKSSRRPLSSKIRNSFPVLWSHFKLAYTNAYVLKWSVWWAFAMSGHLQVNNYIQALWTVIATEGGGSAKYNGGTEAITCALSAAGTLGVGYLTISWKKWSELSIIVISGCMATILIWISGTNSIYSSYLGYIIFRILFQVNLTIASAEISGRIQEDSHGLVFGLNTFVALTFQTILTLVMTDQSGLALSERSQFRILGIGFGILGIVFLAVALRRLIIIIFLRSRASSETDLVTS